MANVRNRYRPPGKTRNGRFPSVASLSIGGGNSIGSGGNTTPPATDLTGLENEWTEAQLFSAEVTFNQDVFFNDEVTFTNLVDFSDNVDFYALTAGLITGKIVGFDWIMDSASNTLEDRLDTIVSGTPSLVGNNNFTGENTFNDATYFNSGIAFAGDEISANVTGFAWIKDSAGVSIESRLTSIGGVSLSADNTFTGENTFNNHVYLNDDVAFTGTSIEANVAGFAWLVDSGGTTLEARLQALIPSGYPTLAGDNTFTGLNTFTTNSVVFSAGFTSVGGSFTDEVVFANMAAQFDAGADFNDPVTFNDTVDFTAMVDMNTQKITNLATATANGDAVNLAKLNSVVSALDYLEYSDSPTLTGDWEFDPTSGNETLFKHGLIVNTATSGVNISGNAVQLNDSVLTNGRIAPDEFSLEDAVGYLESLSLKTFLKFTGVASPTGSEGKLFYIKTHATLDDGLYIHNGSSFQAIKTW